MRLFTLFLLLSVIACASSKQGEPVSNIKNNPCFEDISKNPKNKNIHYQPIKDSSKYILTGIGDNFEIGVIVSNGVGENLLLCDEHGGNCGKSTNKYKSSEDWRCPEIDTITESLTEIAACFDKSGEHGAYYLQLMTLRHGNDFSSCLTKGTIVKLDEEIARIEPK